MTFKYLQRLILSAVLLVICLLPLAAEEGTDSLMKAYQREFVYLDNEIRILEERIAEVEDEGGLRVREAREELQELEVELLSLQDNVARRQEELRIVEEEESSSGDAFDTVITIITQAGTRLDKSSVPSFRESLGSDYEELDDQQKIQGELEYVFEASLDLLTVLGTIRSEEGQFFLPNGKQVDGTLVRVGQIAAFGSHEKFGGTLAPAGGGRFHLVKEEQADVAARLARGEMVKTLPLFLFESTDKLVEGSKVKTLKDTLDGGGAIGYVIIALGLIGLVLVAIRAWTLWGVAKGNKEEEVDTIVALIEKRDFKSALSHCSARLSGAAQRVMDATINGLMHDPKKVEDTIAESVLNEQPALERFRTAISVFAAVAPLLGLLGTVTGMIATFDIITLYGTGDPKLLSGGISEALVTTEFGLIVAIPTLLLGNLLSTWSDSINSNLEVSALRMVNATSGFKGTKKAKKKKKKNKDAAE